MTFTIPSAERRLSQPNNSDVNGNIYASRNIDLDEEGYIKLAQGAVSLYSENDDADFNVVNSMFHGEEVYYVGSDLFKNSPISLNFKNLVFNVTSGDTTPPSPGAEEDGVFFNGSSVVTDGDTLKYRVSGTWNTITGTPTASTSYPSVLALFPNQNSVLFARGNKVARINTSWAVTVTLTLPTDYIVTSIDTNGNYAYIATRHAENGEAMMFIWTGINTTNDGSYGSGTYEISTIKKYQSSVVCVTSLGQLLQFNGSGFTELASLPVYFTRSNWADASNNNDNIGNRGMVVDGDIIYLIVNTKVTDIDRKVLPNMLGAIWCYDPKVGLYQKYSTTNNEVIADTEVDSADINTSTDVITVSGITVPVTGSPVYYDAGGTEIGGLISETWYYTIKVTDTTFKVALTYEDAINGTAINLTSATDLNDFFFIKQNDYGQGYNEGQSSILVLNNAEFDETQLGRIIYAADVHNQTGTQVWRLNAVCPKIRNYGYFVTPKMFAQATKDQFPSINLRFKPLKYGDKITVKYKTQERVGLPAVPRSISYVDSNVTWSSTTTFSTPASPGNGYYDFSTVQIGDEVEVINGSGSGFISTVSSITRNSNYQWTITLTDANPFVAVNDVSLVKIDNWKTLEVIDGSTFSGTDKNIPIDVNSGWIQFKICMEGTEVAIYDTVITNRSFEKTR